jgi:hypothetical protein
LVTSYLAIIVVGIQVNGVLGQLVRIAWITAVTIRIAAHLELTGGNIHHFHGGIIPHQWQENLVGINESVCLNLSK